MESNPEPKMIQDLKERVARDQNSLFYALKHAKDCYEAYRVINETTTRVPHLDAMNVYPAFFSMVDEASIEAMVVTLCRMYEKGKGVTVRELIRLGAEAGYYRNDVAQDLLAKVDAQEPILEKLRTLRDKVMAHHEKNWNSVRAFDVAAITLNMIGIFIEETLDTLNAVRHYTDQEILHFPSYVRSELLGLLDQLGRPPASDQ